MPVLALLAFLALAQETPPRAPDGTPAALGVLTDTGRVEQELPVVERAPNADVYERARRAHDRCLVMSASRGRETRCSCEDWRVAP